MENPMKTTLLAILALAAAGVALAQAPPAVASA